MLNNIDLKTVTKIYKNNIQSFFITYILDKTIS